MAEEKKKNIFVIRSPLQVLNAYEAQKRFDLKNIIFLVVVGNHKENETQIGQLLELVSHDEVIYLHGERSKFLEYVKIVYRLKKERYNALFLGNYSNFGKMLLANLRYEKSYLIDDGTVTIIDHKKIMHRKERIGLRDLRYLLAGLKIYRPKEMAFFTMFDLQPIKNETIIQHSFEHLKEKISHDFTKDEKHVYFLGQNLVETGIVSSKSYRFYLQAIKAHYKGKKVIYMPHRYEKEYENYKDIFDEDFKLGKTDVPIEVYFILKKIIPTTLASFHSSALFSLERIFPHLNLEAFIISPQDFLRRKEDMLACQQMLATHKIEQIPLPQSSL